MVGTAAWLLVALALQDPVQVGAATAGRTPDPAPAAPRGVSAVRLRPAERVTVDGALTDPVWQAVAPITDFVQRDPVEGVPPTERTEVRLLFDDDALYVGARLHDAAADSVVARLARRDRWVAADRFVVYLDPFRDRRSGVFFGINAAGTLYDGTLFNDEWDDDTWDAVWEGKARRDADGWTVEMRIPFSQLRFNPASGVPWGINFERIIARKNERDFLVYTPRSGSGFVSRFPGIDGLQLARAPRRLEVMPYVSARADRLRHAAGDPFNDGSESTLRAGADAKFGVGGNLTVTATALPDFGQVEVDPAVVNLSDVEVFFEERRPFFVEGASTFQFGVGGSNNYWGFSWSGADLFYSRRIGRAPQGSLPGHQYADVPRGADIVGAAKLTGRAGTWNVGGLTALTAREQASFALDGQRFQAEVEPLTSYTVGRAQKEIAGGRQGIGFIGTATWRDLEGSRLATELSRQALAGGVDGWTFLDGSRTWVLTGWAAGTRVDGTADRMTALQGNPVHYFQRPDASHVGVDSLATSLAGWAGRVTLNKQKGRVQFNAAAGAISPGFEANDLGFQGRADLVNGHVVAGYQWPDPGRRFRRVFLNTAVFGSWDFGGTNTWTGIWHGVEAQLLNFWWTRYRVSYNLESQNVRRTRGGPRMLNPAGWNAGVGFDSDDRKAVRFGLDLGVSHAQQGADDSWSVESYAEWRPADRLALRVGPAFEHVRNGAQYLATVADPAATATYGARYLFGELDQRTFSGGVRVNWIFNPRLSFELFAQPLVSSVRYRSVRQLAEPGTFRFEPTALDPAAYSYTFASLRGNAVVRWEYLPGSTLFLVWNQDQQAVEDDGTFNLRRSTRALLGTRANNVFMLKASYWWSR